MSVGIRPVEALDIVDLCDIVSRSPVADRPDARHLMMQGLRSSAACWVGTVDERIACVWGLLAPTLLSNRAYLWLLTTDLVDQHPFLFVRHSQRIVEGILEHFEVITGDCLVTQTRSIRWIRWLGGKFGEPKRQWVPFEIRKKQWPTR